MGADGHTYDGKDDVWALGCMLGGAVTGKLAEDRCSGRALNRTAAKALVDEAAASEKFGGLVAAMLELNPTARHTAQAIELSLLRGELRLTSSGCATIVEEEEGDNEAEQIDLCKLALVGTLKVHSYCVVDFFAISRDGRRVVSGLHSTLKVWDVETGECVATLPCHSPYVTSVAISPDGRRVVSGAIYPDNTLKVWDVATGECVATLEGNSSRVNYWHLNGVGCIDVFPDGQHIVSGRGSSRCGTSRPANAWRR